MSKLILTLLGAALLGLAVLPGLAAPTPPPSAARQVQVKVEWSQAAPVSRQALTISATEDQTATVTLQSSAPGQNDESLTIRPHINADGSITVHLAAARTGANGTSDALSTVSTFRPGTRLTLGGGTSNQGKLTIYATASVVNPAADPFAPPGNFGQPFPKATASR